MSSSCVLMRIILCRYFLLVFISVFSELSDYAVTQPFIKNNEISFSGDFMDFVEDMGRIVYNRNEEKSKSELSKRPSSRQLRVSTKASIIDDSRRNVNKLITQKAALRDVLMMKLVSYYEDKYKLSKTTASQKTDNVVKVGGNGIRYEPFRETTPAVADKEGSVAEVVVI